MNSTQIWRIIDAKHEWTHKFQASLKDAATHRFWGARFDTTGFSLQGQEVSDKAQVRGDCRPLGNANFIQIQTVDASLFQSPFQITDAHQKQQKEEENTGGQDFS